MIALSPRRSATLLSLCLATAALAGAWVSYSPEAQAQPARPSGRDLSLAVGEQLLVPAEGISSYSVANEGIVDVRVPSDRRNLVVVGQRAGTTSLLLLRSGGAQETLQVTVFARRPEAVQAEIENLLEGYTGVQIRRLGARLYLEGGVASEQQQRRVQQIAALYPAQVESLVAIDPTIVERRINVRLDLYFVDFSTNSGRTVGLNWPAYIGGAAPSTQGQATINLVAPMGMGGVGAGIQSAQAIITNQPLPRLDMASNGGWGRILRQATLITANGNEASYRNGGELNYRMIGANGSASLATIPFGTNLTVTPRFDPQSSRIDIRVDADISDPVETGSDIPGRNISHLTTLVNLQLGQSVVMSGFRSRQQTEGTTGLPGLRRIPILGYLFGSETAREQEREGMIFIVPTVVEGVSRSSQDRVAEALRQYEQFSGSIDELRLYEPTGTQYR
ncbi:MAG: pilus assembly protein N-terminal domain-containing protein [Myxococcales bacterium]|nr:pilus assembly protein N-terminal domain-containing protein [Myxococcales bacterium]